MTRFQKSGAAGFTLLEVLVVMSLLSLVMLGMGSALRTTAQTGERVDQRLMQADELRTAASFIYSTLGRISVKKINAPVSAGESPYFFVGQPDAVAWIGIMPARYGAGGRYYFKLSLGELDGKRGLVIHYLPWSDASPLPDWTQAEGRVLVLGATAFSLQYLDTNMDAPQWVSAWTSPEGPPDRVMLALHGVEGPWPSLVVPLRPTPASATGAGSGGAVFGGSTP
ncbi:MAG: hypothetical protein A3F76_06350 [Burkholderiales bacterium RIFCSPLOWO2_12_FULL_65_40]|nr:MAG: hypothetical protein A3F76_06350 [Burkholderiales bacterium RIFCSPLOWO2_12_FULL_65_40]